MDQAFAAIWNQVRADDPFRDYAHDRELRLAIGRNLLNLVADGVTDPIPLRWLTIESLLFPRRYKATTRIQGALNCKKNIMTGSHSLPSTTTGLSGDSLSMPSRFSEATTGRAMPRGSGKRKEA
jgi:hypothetical protein